MCFVERCTERGILLRYTPIDVPWLHLAESLQRSMVRQT
jgi:hypothetical protein